nr:hypothetical protein Iba_chr11bCG10860 [Ipomoea batatas]
MATYLSDRREALEDNDRRNSIICGKAQEAPAFDNSKSIMKGITLGNWDPYDRSGEVGQQPRVQTNRKYVPPDLIKARPCCLLP